MLEPNNISTQIRLGWKFTKMKHIALKLFGEDRVATTINLEMYIKDNESLNSFSVRLNPLEEIIYVSDRKGLNMAYKLKKAYEIEFERPFVINEGQI